MGNCITCGKKVGWLEEVCVDCYRIGKTVSEQYERELVVNSEEGMSGGEWLGAFFCSPYGLIKYFEWKKTYPKKSSQVCTLYLILMALNILFALLRIATESSY